MKYIDLRTLGPDKFQVWACHDGTNTALIIAPDTGKIDFNHKAMGLRVKKNYHPPTGVLGTFTKQEAISLAHQIGRYLFKLGDLVYAYTHVDGLRNDNFFDAR